MLWLKRLRDYGLQKVGCLTNPARRVYIRVNSTPLGRYYGAVLYENGIHIHTIGMETYDQERIDRIKESWEVHGTFVR